MLPTKLAFVDIETTGMSVLRDRIIEVGILRVEGNALVKTYQTLLNPQMHISPFIEQMTGISKNELETAPTFDEVLHDIQVLLEDCVLVAHNVRFDYGFLRNEFLRYGISFSSKHFCTVKLSKKLFPHYKHHNLDAIIERFGITCVRRHRAFDDAKVLWDFFQRLQEKISKEILESALAFTSRKPSLPTGISPKTIDMLPEQPGVYIFYGEKGVPLYVGKSKNIKERVLSHFMSDYTSSKEMSLCQQITHIESITTAGELGALLKESALVKQLQPIYNRKLRTSRKLVVLKRKINTNGYQTVEMETVDMMDSSEIDLIVGIFRSKKQAKNFLINLCKQYTLCEKLLGIEKTSSACFGYRLNQCKGACIRQESTLKYNMRCIMAFSKHRLKSWPFDGPVVIKEKSIDQTSEEKFLVDQWCLLGDLKTPDMVFDLDLYKILVAYMKEPGNVKNISRIPREYTREIM